MVMITDRQDEKPFQQHRHAALHNAALQKVNYDKRTD
jgi:hypothetical protein